MKNGNLMKEKNLNVMAKKYVVLLGASVGKSWDIQFLPERINNKEYVFEYVPHFGFDKSEKVEEIISRQVNKPNAIFIKECAAYFPGNLTEYKELMKKWIDKCQENDIIPIPTTVVPVTRLHSFKKILIDLIRLRNPWRSGSPFSRNEGIIEYNEWIKDYARENGLAVLNLEAAVYYNENNRYLREDLARIDGLHLNRKAYHILDKFVIPTLEKVNW